MSSVCPTESVFAELAAGTLADDARRALEEHLDQCDACTELVGMLGELPSVPELQHTMASSEGGSTDQRQGPWWLTDRAAIAATMLATQCFWSIVLWVPAIEWLVGVERATSHEFLWAFAVYVSSVGILGPMLAVASLVAVRQRRRWAARLITVHAVMASFSLAMTPLSIVALLYLRRQLRTRSGSEARADEP